MLYFTCCTWLIVLQADVVTERTGAPHKLYPLTRQRDIGRYLAISS